MDEERTKLILRLVKEGHVTDHEAMLLMKRDVEIVTLQSQAQHPSGVSVWPPDAHLGSWSPTYHAPIKEAFVPIKG